MTFGEITSLADAFGPALNGFVEGIAANGKDYHWPPVMIDFFRAEARYLRGAAAVLEEIASYHDGAGTGD